MQFDKLTPTQKLNDEDLNFYCIIKKKTIDVIWFLVYCSLFRKANVLFFLLLLFAINFITTTFFNIQWKDLSNEVSQDLFPISKFRGRNCHSKGEFRDSKLNLFHLCILFAFFGYSNQWNMVQSSYKTLNITKRKEALITWKYCLENTPLSVRL